MTESAEEDKDAVVRRRIPVSIKGEFLYAVWKCPPLMSRTSESLGDPVRNKNTIRVMKAIGM
jgi:hypothetical protein